MRSRAVCREPNEGDNHNGEGGGSLGFKGRAHAPSLSLMVFPLVAPSFLDPLPPLLRYPAKIKIALFTPYSVSREGKGRGEMGVNS